jgi:hypothetical protein
MKISEMIAELQMIREKYGELQVADMDNGCFFYQMESIEVIDMVKMENHYTSDPDLGRVFFILHN